MYKIKIFALLFFLTGCVTTQSTNIVSLGDEYYREIISKSDIHKSLKEYLLKNNIKLNGMNYISNVPTGALGNIALDGQMKSMVSLDNNKWFRATMDMLLSSEMAGFILEAPGYQLSYCGDYTHAIVGQNGTYFKMDYTYFLSKTTEQQSKQTINMLSDCNYDSFLGDVFYKKIISKSATYNAVKVSAIRVDNAKPMSSEDILSLIMKDTADQAITSMLTDPDLLQALKDYKLTGGLKITESATTKNKVIVPDSSLSVPSINKEATIELDKFKVQCKELGFKLGTTDYGNCVLQLMK